MKYKEITFILKLILTMSHGQASVERGFSLNNNISPETVMSKRIVRDPMICHQLKPHTIEVNKPILVSFKSARQKYAIHREEDKKRKEETAAEKAMYITTDIDKIKLKCKQLEKVMDDEFIECMKLAEQKSELSYVIIGNGLKRKCDQTRGDRQLLEKEMIDLEEKNRNLLSL